MDRTRDSTDEQIAEACKALDDLVKLLARASAEACHRLGIQFDMDDPEVAGDVMRATFEGLFYSRPRTGKKPGARGKSRAS